MVVVRRDDGGYPSVVRDGLGRSESISHARRLQVVVVVGGMGHGQRHRGSPVDSRGGTTIGSRSHGEGAESRGACQKGWGPLPRPSCSGGRATAVRPSIAAMRLAGEACSAVEGGDAGRGGDGESLVLFVVVVEVEGGSEVIRAEEEKGCRCTVAGRVVSSGLLTVTTPYLRPQ